MLVKKLKDCPEFLGMDKTMRREILHRKNDGIDLRFSLAHTKVAPGTASLPHRLRTTEVYYILRGHGVMHTNKQSEKVKQGCAIYVPPDAVQYIENVGNEDLEYLCLVDPAWRPEDVEIVT
jgi:mannose-6-phosphate isomerase-like protein (cupin superfamily)